MGKRKYSQQELTKELTKLSKTLTESLRRIEKSQLTSLSTFYTDASEAFVRNVPYISTDRKGRIRYASGAELKKLNISYNEQKRILEQYKQFMKFETRTIKGTKATIKARKKGIETKLGHSISDLSFNQIGQLFRTIREAEMVDILGSDKILENSEQLLAYKSQREIKNSLDKIHEANRASQAGIISKAKMWDTLIGSQAEFKNNIVK